MVKKGQLTWNNRNDVRDNAKEIIRLYKDELISCKEIAKIYGCGIILINNILKENRIRLNQPERMRLLYKFGKIKTWNEGLTKETDERIRRNCENSGKTLKILWAEGKIKSYNKRWDIEDNKNEIIELFVEEDKTWKELGEIFNCSPTLIKNILHKNNINTSRIGKKFSKKHIKNIGLTHLGKKQPKEVIEKRRQKLIGHEVSDKTRKKLKESNLKAYSNLELLKKLSDMRLGEKNPSWNNGSSFEPYGFEFNERLKEQTRERDNNQCQECGRPQEELKERLHSHHIDYNKKNNSPLNLISLCNNCHSKTNSNRKHWENYFKMKMFIKELFNPQNILIFNENKQLIGVERIE